jgi:hypothetical protein
MEQVKEKTVAEITKDKNPIVKMIADKKRIVKAIENGESLDSLKGIKIVSPI